MSRSVRIVLVLALASAAVFLSGLSVLADQQGPGVNAPVAQIERGA
jgi:hypothetical protein